MADLPATELLPVPTVGRTFRAERVVRLGDVDPNGELRLDAIARYLQDVATDDALDAGLDNALGWVVRRSLIDVRRRALMSEHMRLTTFCTGSGRSWAERRTSIVGEAGGSIEAVSLWVQVDVATGRPARLGDDFDRLYGAAAAGRVVSSKLSLRKLTPRAAERTWTFRRSDLDQLGHVNNAAQWSVLEQLLQERGHERIGVGEVEFLQPAPADVTLDLLVDADRVDLSADGTPVTVLRWNR